LERADTRVACGCFSLDLTGERLGDGWTGSLAGKEEGSAGATEVLAVLEEALGDSEASRKETLEVLLGEAVGGVGGSARVGVRRMGGGGGLGAAGRELGDTGDAAGAVGGGGTGRGTAGR
jgi:hypothetical protein